MHRITAITIATVVAALTLTGGGTASAGGGCHTDVFTDEANTQVELTKNCFAPMVVRVQPGDTVTFTNSDPVVHTVTGVANTWGNDENVRSGESVSYQFDASGVFPYFCYLHPSMVGAVVVGDGSAASSRTADDGVKAVSAQIPGDQADGMSAAVTENDGRDTTVPLVIGVGMLAAMAGFAGALVLRWKRTGVGD